MNEKICISKDYFYLIIIIFAVFTHIHYVTKNQKDYIESSDSQNKSINDNVSSRINKIQTIIKNDDTEDLFIGRDRKVIEDDLVAPTKRLPRHAYPTRYIKNLINIPTRGYPDNYQQMGILSRKEDEKILSLFGRQTYPGSNQYEYYVIDNNNNSNIKVPLNLLNKRELYNNDVIPISWLDESKGLFEVQIFDYNVPRYNPYDY